MCLDCISICGSKKGDETREESQHHPVDGEIRLSSAAQKKEHTHILLLHNSLKQTSSWQPPSLLLLGAPAVLAVSPAA